MSHRLLWHYDIILAVRGPDYRSYSRRMTTMISGVNFFLSGVPGDEATAAHDLLHPRDQDRRLGHDDEDDCDVDVDI